MKILAGLLGMFLLLSCGAYIGVDYDEQTDFSGYTSYNFYPSIESGLSQLDDNRIMKITDSLLRQKGFTKSEDPQLYVNFFAVESVSNSRSTIGIGVGGGGRNVGGGISGGIPIGGKTINQRLTFDLIDAEEDDLVWQATADGDMKEKSTPLQKEKYYEGVLVKILKKFPPGQK